METTSVIVNLVLAVIGSAVVFTGCGDKVGVANRKGEKAGADGLTFDAEGNLYSGNFGDGVMYKVAFKPDGSGGLLDQPCEPALRGEDLIAVNARGEITFRGEHERAVALMRAAAPAAAVGPEHGGHRLLRRVFGARDLGVQHAVAALADLDVGDQLNARRQRGRCLGPAFFRGGILCGFGGKAERGRHEEQGAIRGVFMASVSFKNLRWRNVAAHAPRQFPCNRIVMPSSARLMTKPMALATTIGGAAIIRP